MAVSTVDDDTLDEKNEPPPKVMPAPPTIYPSGRWSTHLAAFAAKGLGAPDRAPVLTLLKLDHSSVRV
jgi:hypothetical protein